MIGAEKLEVMFMTMSDIDKDGVEEAVVTERTQQTIRIFKRLNTSGTSWSERILKIPASTGILWTIPNHSQIIKSNGGQLYQRLCR